MSTTPQFRRLGGVYLVVRDRQSTPSGKVHRDGRSWRALTSTADLGTFPTRIAAGEAVLAAQGRLSA